MKKLMHKGTSLIAYSSAVKDSTREDCSWGPGSNPVRELPRSHMPQLRAHN